MEGEFERKMQYCLQCRWGFEPKAKKLERIKERGNSETLTLFSFVLFIGRRERRIYIPLGRINALFKIWKKK